MSNVSKYDPVIVELMVNLLRIEYPIKKYRHKRYFKKGVKINGNIYKLPDEAHIIELTLKHSLRTLYNSNIDEVNYALSKFYPFIK